MLSNERERLAARACEKEKESVGIWSCQASSFAIKRRVPSAKILLAPEFEFTPIETTLWRVAFLGREKGCTSFLVCGLLFEVGVFIWFNILQGRYTCMFKYPNNNKELVPA